MAFSQESHYYITFQVSLDVTFLMGCKRMYREIKLNSPLRVFVKQHGASREES